MNKAELIDAMAAESGMTKVDLTKTHFFHTTLQAVHYKP